MLYRLRKVNKNLNIELGLEYDKVLAAATLYLLAFK